MLSQFFILSDYPIRHIHMDKILRSTSAILRENVDVNFPTFTKMFYQLFSINFVLSKVAST